MKRATTLAARCQARLDAWLAARGVRRLLLGYSGGLDSTVLLHVLRDYARMRGLALAAHHVDHALQAASADWRLACAELAAQLGVDFSSERLGATPPAGASIEDWARQQRYAALLARCGSDTALLTAHHENDQAETVLLHALRGSGPHGLAGIRAHGRHGDVQLLRPVLDETRATLHAYAVQHGLTWIDDPSNADQRYARNRLRGAVLPVLEHEFAGAAAALARVARLQGEVVEVLDALAAQLLGAVHNLPLALLRDNAEALRPYLIKHWLARRGAPPPGRTQLEHMLHDMLSARDDGLPSVAWRGVAVRRYDDRFFLTAATLPAPPDDGRIWSPPWSRLGLPQGEIEACAAEGEGADLERLAAAPLSLRYRQGGERLRLHAGGPRRELKHLFQEWRVPPWQRHTWPLLYVGDALAVVPGQAVAAEFRAGSERPALIFNWRACD